MKELIYQKFSAIIPSFNEASRLCRVVEETLKIKELSELIFVDDGSIDETTEKIECFKTDKRFIYVRHKQNKGKGAAMRSGLKRAKNEVILFLDADLKNISAQKIKKIVWPVLTNQVDLSRGTFRRRRGRVTEYAVKPMMKILFPEIYFNQPITGQICGKKEFLKNIDFENEYGVDIGILFDAINSGQRIIEVDIGKLEHKANTAEDIAEMSFQVLETMIKKAGFINHKYKIVIFTLDNTLVEKDILKPILHKLKKESEYLKIMQEYKSEKIDFKTMTKNTAALLSGFSPEEVAVACKRVKYTKYAKEVISILKKRKYKVAIISTNLSPIVFPIAAELGISELDCIYVEKNKDDVYSGKISRASNERWLLEERELAFKKAFLGILRMNKIKPTEAIMVANSVKALPLIQTAGLGVAFKPVDKALKENAEKTIHLLAELLAIVE